MTKGEQHAYRNEVVELFRESGMSQKAFTESYGIAKYLGYLDQGNPERCN